MELIKKINAIQTRQELDGFINRKAQYFPLWKKLLATPLIILRYWITK